jgi:hypothetical protein
MQNSGLEFLSTSGKEFHHEDHKDHEDKKGKFSFQGFGLLLTFFVLFVVLFLKGYY